MSTSLEPRALWFTAAIASYWALEGSENKDVI